MIEVQAEAPTLDDDPGPQLSQLLAPELEEKLPARQLEQKDAPAAE